ncbi:MAG: ABC transporter ATP-binding protein [Anaerolineales bacterium]|jgi:peptide/nickel transport system ATP-binding protein
MAEGGRTLLRVEGLKKYFPIQRGLLRRTTGYVKAVDGVNLFINEGETLGLVGESGCGKTTTGRCILRVIEPTTGEITFWENGQPIKIHELEPKELKFFRKYMQMIFQDPYSSLNPRMTVLELVGEPLIAHNLASGRELEDRVADTLVSVGLKVEYLRRYPHSFSGGQRQRIGIARALVQRPKLIICDEPVSALDVSVQSQILNLLQDLQQEYHLTYLFIAHDMSVVRHISDRIAVMYVGKLVEIAETEELLTNPKHPYSEALLSAIPRPNPHHKMDRIILSGEAADPSNPPTGCVFHPRCKYADDLCKVEVPSWAEVSQNHFAACHFSDELQLEGITGVGVTV